MIEKNDKMVRLNDQEMMLGGLLARGIPGGQNMNDCPTIETLSEFIDAKLLPDARESVAAHLADCSDCYAVVAESLAIREEMNSRSRARIKRSVFYAVPSALAAAAVLLLVFRVTQPAQEFIAKPAQELAYQQAPIEKKPLPEPGNASIFRSFSRELAGRLSKGSNAVSFTPAVGNRSRPEKTFGFTSGVPLEKAAFRIGACLADLEVALKAKDRERVETFAKKLFELMKPLETSSGLIPPVAEPKRAHALAGNEMDRYEGLSAAVEALFKNRTEAIFLQLGAWVETAGLAAEANDAAFFNASEVSVFRNELEKRNEPVGTLGDLSKLEAAISSGLIQPDQFMAVNRLLADIREMY
jgi:hypothetical protein